MKSAADMDGPLAFDAWWRVRRGAWLRVMFVCVAGLIIAWIVAPPGALCRGGIWPVTPAPVAAVAPDIVVPATSAPTEDDMAHLKRVIEAERERRDFNQYGGLFVDAAAIERQLCAWAVDASKPGASSTSIMRIYRNGPIEEAAYRVCAALGVQCRLTTIGILDTMPYRLLYISWYS